MNEWIGFQLTELLKLEHGFAQEFRPIYSSINPCWIEPIQDSKSNFDSLIVLFHDRYYFLAEKIMELRSLTDVNRRIRRTGSYYIFETRINHLLVNLTVEVQNGYQQIEKLIQRAFDELSDTNKICDESNCICQQQFANCPFEQ